MPNVLVWGKTRDLIAGDLPTGMPVAEVSSLDEARAQADGRGCLLLVESAILADRAEALQKWLRGGASTSTLLVAVAEAASGDDLLRDYPFLDDLLVKPVTAGRLRLRLDRAFDALHARRVVRQLEQALDRKSEELHELNKIGVALSVERDTYKLLDLILGKSREITAADAGSLYRVERGKDASAQTDDCLRFKLTQNDSVLASFEEFTMPLSETSIAGYVALTGRSVNVADAYNLPSGFPFQISRSFDDQSGYRTKSMLVVPMRDHKEEVIGVVQLINKKKDARAVLRPVGVVDEEVIPFTRVDEELVTSLASQAAVALENNLLIQSIKDLFDSFVRASVVTIEKRDPTTSGHSERVATLTVALAKEADAQGSGPFRDLRFTKDQLEEIRYASLLHDFGKVGVKEKYLLKKKKLYERELELIVQRFATIDRTLQVQHLELTVAALRAGADPARIAEMDRDFAVGRAEVDRLLKVIREANEPAVVEAESVRAVLQELARRTYPDLKGEEQPYLTPTEVEALSIARGSLTPKERDEINEHVQLSYEFLKKLPWDKTEYRRVADIAGSHHEKLDGSGYPKRLTAEAIPIQAQMMTISDIYDALTALDRPYKNAVPVERALDILKKEEAGRGKINGDLLDLFVGAKIFELTRRPSTTEVAR